MYLWALGPGEFECIGEEERRLTAISVLVFRHIQLPGPTCGQTKPCSEAASGRAREY